MLCEQVAQVGVKRPAKVAVGDLLLRSEHERHEGVDQQLRPAFGRGMGVVFDGNVNTTSDGSRGRGRTSHKLDRLLSFQAKAQ